MPNYTPHDKRINLKEIQSILTEIDVVMKIRAYGELPDISWKRGGYTASAYPSQHRIEIRENSWLKMSLAGKRLLLIHECVHLKGVHHTGIGFFSNATPDLVSIEFYKRIYGKDTEYKEVMKQVDIFVLKIMENV